MANVKHLAQKAQQTLFDALNMAPEKIQPRTFKIPRRTDRHVRFTPEGNHWFHDDELQFGRKDETIPKVDENGNVTLFHWTPKENVENILKTGLVADLGADAIHYQKRPGVWTSLADNNPMERNYNTGASVTSGYFDMVPLRIDIPKKEYDKMWVDHTGQTGHSQVNVFRAPDGNPYGSVVLKDSEGVPHEKPVAIPPEYISRHELDPNWTMQHPSRWGSTIPGWTPFSKDEHPDVTWEQFKKENLGNPALSDEELIDMIENNDEYIKEQALRGWMFNQAPISQRRGLHENVPTTNVELLESQYADDAFKNVVNAEKDWMEGQLDKEGLTPFDLYKINTSIPKQGEGAILRGSNRTKYDEVYDIFSPYNMEGEYKWRAPSPFDKIRRKLQEGFIDETPMGKFVTKYGALDANREPSKKWLAEKSKSLDNDEYEGLMENIKMLGNTDADDVARYLEDAGVNKDVFNDARREIGRTYDMIDNVKSYPGSFVPEGVDPDSKKSWDDYLIKKFEAKRDSLDKVIGHMIGRKVGKYRHDRGVYNKSFKDGE